MSVVGIGQSAISKIDGPPMTLTGKQVREACELLRWSRYDLQRRTALPLSVIDQVMMTEHTIEATLAREIVLKDAFQRAGIEFVADGLRLQGDVI